MTDADDLLLNKTMTEMKQIRESLGSQGTFRLRVLIDMVILELKKAQSLSTIFPRPGKPDES